MFLLEKIVSSVDYLLNWAKGEVGEVDLLLLQLVAIWVCNTLGWVAAAHTEVTHIVSESVEGYELFNPELLWSVDSTSRKIFLLIVYFDLADEAMGELLASQLSVVELVSA